jgi:CRP-like cAMP-binding protein
VIAWQILEPIPLFKECSAAEIRRLARYGHQTYYRNFATIYDAGSPSKVVSIVLKGEVIVRKETTPRHEPTHFNVVVTAGEMFGFGEMMLEHYYTSTVARGECVLLEIAKQDFVRHFMAIPSLREKVLRAFSDIVRILMNKVASGGTDELALYLYQLSRKSGKTIGGKIHIQKKVRQPEVASVLNLSREHVTRLFAKLRAEKVVQFNRGFPIIDKAWLDRTVKDKELAASIQYRPSPIQ